MWTGFSAPRCCGNERSSLRAWTPSVETQASARQRRQARQMKSSSRLKLRSKIKHFEIKHCIKQNGFRRRSASRRFRAHCEPSLMLTYLKYALQLQRMTLCIWNSTSWTLITASVRYPSRRSWLHTQNFDMPLVFNVSPCQYVSF